MMVEVQDSGKGEATLPEENRWVLLLHSCKQRVAHFAYFTMKMQERHERLPMNEVPLELKELEEKVILTVHAKKF